jgi:hypothetical protein
MLVVRFRTRSDVPVLNAGRVPPNEIQSDPGTVPAEIEETRLTALPAVNADVDRESARLLAAHQPTHDNCRILRQRFSVTCVPVTEVHYQLKGRKGKGGGLWIHGLQQAVYAPHLPKSALLDWRAIGFVAVAAISVVWFVVWLLQSSLCWMILGAVAATNAVLLSIHLAVGKRRDRRQRDIYAMKRAVDEDSSTALVVRPSVATMTVLWILLSLFPTLLHLAAIGMFFNNDDHARRVWAYFWPESSIAATPASVSSSGLANPSEGQRHYELGMAAKKRGDIRTATEEFRQALHCDSKHAGAHYALGWCHVALGQYDAAITEFETVLALAPGTTKAKEANRAIQSLQSQR